jgi:hypothetical protein
MNRYRNRSGIPMVARGVGWIALCLAVLLCPIGLIQMLGSVSLVTQTSHAAGLFDFYLGTDLLIGGVFLLIGSLVLIIASEIARVLIDIEHRIVESARAALSSVHPSPAQSAARSVQQDRRETRLANSEIVSIDDTRSTMPGGLPALEVEHSLVSVAEKQGYAVRETDTCVVFTRDGRVELLRDYLERRE